MSWSRELTGNARFERRGSAPWLVLTGEIDHSVTARVTDDMIALYRSENLMHIDASEVTFIDSTGLSLLVRVRNVCGSAKLAVSSRAVDKIMRATGLTQLFLG